uniref:Uncharacterized protein n=1 Tax=Cryptomonas curvata TaxID=233186 RepID=A0A7S0LTU1_9CRYP|mmetsp:Transcript_10507/g.22460  ORF Transcript_10507/g.22460 Transcript_10507/m.22460 type:complete len:236 (+) Transcript_10507:60-767(+)
MDKQPVSRKVVLTPKLAREIYAEKLRILTPKDLQHCVKPLNLLRGQSVSVANRYNVSAKTIRDIWNRKTWIFDTSCLWHYEDVDRTDNVSCSRLANNYRSPNYVVGKIFIDQKVPHPSTMVHPAYTATGLADRLTTRMEPPNLYLCSPSSRTPAFQYSDVPSTFQGPIDLHRDLHFLSVSEDPCFLSTLAASEPDALPWPSMPLDPFHADWPHWDSAAAHPPHPSSLATPRCDTL